MPRKKQTGGAYADKGRSFTVPAGDVGEVVRGAGMEVLLNAPQAQDSAAEALKAIAIYDEGWLRIVSHEMGKTLYYKFKFSRGKYQHSYVFYRSDDNDPSRALWGLLGKIEAVYAGSLRPTPDTPFE